MNDFLITAIPFAKSPYDYLLLLMINDTGEVIPNAIKFPKKAFQYLYNAINLGLEEKMDPLASPYPVEVTQELVKCFDGEYILQEKQPTNIGLSCIADMGEELWMYSKNRELLVDEEDKQMLSMLSLATSILLTVISLAGYQPLFRALNVPADAFQDACNYMKIICYGTVFVFGYNAVCSVLKGLGDSKSPLCFVGIATIINVGLDIILVGPLGMGTEGAAYATITAQGISFVISIFYLKRHHVFFGTTVCKKLTVQWDKIVAILKIGLPTAIQMVVVNTAYLLVTGMLNQFGTSVSAASGVGLQINTFAGMPCWAVGQAVTAMVGQCMGAEQIKRARKVVKIGLLVNIAMTLVVVLCVQVFAEQLILLFGSNSREVVTDGVYYLRVCCGVNSLIYAAMYTLDSFAIGVGAANVAMLNALLDAVVVRLPVSWILAFTLGMGFPGIYFGQALSPILPAFVGFIYFKSGIWERKSLIQKNRKEGNPE